MNVRFRSIDTWPYEPTSSREWGQFKAGWDSTLNLLDFEMSKLGASEVVIECFLRRSEIRMDGWPRSDARTPSHPGVAVHFDTQKLGHLRYATDRYRDWKHNLRAIALGLQALRAVDRYGITRGGEQYRGFGELPAGLAMPAHKMSVEEAAKFVCKHAGMPEASWGGLLDSISSGRPEMQYGPAYRMAAKRLHPDTGGSVDEFQTLQEAKTILDGYGRSP
jgi:hypothetical protein